MRSRYSDSQPGRVRCLGSAISYLEITALAGAATVAVAAGFVISRPRTASRIAFVGSVLLLLYYGFAVVTALANVLHFGSRYQTRLFFPPLLVFITTFQASRGLLVNFHPVARPKRWALVALCRECGSIPLDRVNPYGGIQLHRATEDRNR